MPSDSPTPPRPKLTLGRKISFAVATAVVFFLLVEGLLRIAGFQFAADVQRMEFTFPMDDYNQGLPEPFLERDDELFWKPRAGALGQHNSMGLYGPEFQPEKPADVLRIVCLGDSCTHFGPTPYPEMLQSILQQRVAGDQSHPKRIEVINAGVIGYTSHQGLTMMRSKVIDWDPDLVTVYFGWNDHWLARGLQDKDQSSEAPGAVSSLLGGLRSVQLAEMLTGSAQQGVMPDTKRVELADYESNLKQIAKLCDQVPCESVFLTAPHAMDLSIPEYLYTSGEVSDPTQLIPLHESYNTVVRNVAKETSSQLVDLAAKIDGIPKEPFFLDDHIHLTMQGKAWTASQIAAVIADVFPDLFSDGGQP